MKDVAMMLSRDHDEVFYIPQNGTAVREEQRPRCAGNMRLKAEGILLHALVAFVYTAIMFSTNELRQLTSKCCTGSADAIVRIPRILKLKPRDA